jgi:hypothetical protein
MGNLLTAISKINKLPALSLVSPAANRIPSEKRLAGFLECQRLAQNAAKEVAGLLEEGMTEIHAADLLNDCLAEKGVTSFFHKAFAWWGGRTRFDGCKGVPDFLPTERKLEKGDVYILDVAPIDKGFMCDIGYSNIFGENEEYEKAMEFLTELRASIPGMFNGSRSGGEVWRAVDAEIRSAGYTNIHEKYPFSVLGHRIHFHNSEGPSVGFMNFGWQSYWSLLSRGLFGQLLNQNFEGDLRGLWAIEPHIGGLGFGVKFEEILVVEAAGARWLEEEIFV